MEQKTNKKALASIILGIFSIILVPTIIPSIICGVIAIIFGCIGKKDITETNQSNKGLGIGGIITGTLGLVASVIVVVVLFTLLNSPFMLSRSERFMNNFEKIMQENIDPNFDLDDINDIMENNVEK